MKLFHYGKDGGKDSVVSGYWLIECKSLFSIVLLRFGDGSREAFHNHAFNSISWLLKGFLVELIKNEDSEVNLKTYQPTMTPIVTRRNTMHKVHSFGTSWVLSFRGPWNKEWKEYLPKEDVFVTLTNGRKIVE